MYAYAYTRTRGRLSKDPLIFIFRNLVECSFTPGGGEAQFLRSLRNRDMMRHELTVVLIAGLALSLNCYHKEDTGDADYQPWVLFEQV
jgi:hypothetical protein